MSSVVEVAPLRLPPAPPSGTLLSVVDTGARVVMTVALDDRRVVVLPADVALVLAVLRNSSAAHGA